MCGIAGFTVPRGIAPPTRRVLYGDRAARMAASLRHRGPDVQSVLLLDGLALAHTRLAILDRAGGSQPMRDPATGVTLVFNGEVFNYREVRGDLEGYPFRTRSDTEVVLAAFLRWGEACLGRFNGQFAMAWWDPRTCTLCLARDRVGILPLLYTFTEDGIAFASEAKALVAAGFLEPRIDPRGLKQTLQLWSPVPPRTCLEGVSTLPAGCVGRFSGGELTVRRWWQLDLDGDPVEIADAEAVERVGTTLEDAVRLRLHADVPVGAYLSGGIDSSLLCAVAQRATGGSLSTYSVRFEDPAFDESPYQHEVASALATRHHSVLATGAAIGSLLPEVVRHAEQVLVRAAPAPLFALSGLVQEDDVRVVLTGEGSDEILLGYDLFAEARVRQFWARRPDSPSRSALLGRLYPYLPLAAQGPAALRSVYGTGIERPGSPEFSHLVRWTASSRLWRLLSADLLDLAADEDPTASVLATMPDGFLRWRPLARAQALEMQTLLSGNLLSAQGDRMLMAHSVEGRFPYLDHRLIELAARLPLRQKLRALAGKWPLRAYARSRIPPSVITRPKLPYRAPPPTHLIGAGAPGWAREVLSEEAVRAIDVFDADRVRRLVAKLSGASRPPSEFDSMAITAVATAQLLTRVLRASREQPLGEIAVEIA